MLESQITKKTKQKKTYKCLLQDNNAKKEELMTNQEVFVIREFAEEKDIKGYKTTYSSSCGPLSLSVSRRKISFVKLDRKQQEIVIERDSDSS